MTSNIPHTSNPSSALSDNSHSPPDNALKTLVIEGIRDVCLRLVDALRSNGGSLNLAKYGVELRVARPRSR